MPATRPRASFEPIPPDFDVRTFVETADNFQYVDRISHEMVLKNGVDQFEKLVLLHVIIGGKPLVIDGFDEALDPWTFTPSWLRDNHGEKVENARNLSTQENIPLTVKHYLKHMGKLTEQFFADPERYRNKTCQRIYLKDIDCPQVWQDKLKEHIPTGLFYLNESTGEFGGPGALDEPGGRKGRGIARAGDLMSSLPVDMRAENLMCYIGHEGTYTPSHREMCASLGQNIMVNASGAVSEDGKSERPGSSIWFMTETKDRHLVSEYWLSVLGHDIEVENHFAQLVAWKKAPFRTYVVEQRPGDFILIPPLAPHQVWNRGTRTMKIAWNRTTVETLEMALSEALPNSRVVCRDEQYKNKAIVYYTLQKYSVLIQSARAQVERGGEAADAIQRSVKVRQIQRDFKRLLELYKSILLTEMFATDTHEKPEFLPYDSNVTCAYCRCNIFNRFLSCKTCKNMFSEEIEEPYDICMDCYCMGRSCGCQSGYTWVEQWKWKDLIHKYEEWRAQIIDIDGHVSASMPLPLKEERRYLGKKTLAQVCQEQLRIRPFVDIKNSQPEEESDEDEPTVDEWGQVKKSSTKKSKQWLANHKSCHFCLKRHPKWKMAFCTNCDLAYCYGTLFRAHDMMPLQSMEEFSWKCPHCRRICNTGACRRDPRQTPYEPKGTLLGHDTKKVADIRSTECLVDFSVSNLNFMREEEGMGQAAMNRRLLQAEMDKRADPSLDARYIDEHELDRDGIAYSPVEDADGNGQHGNEINGTGSFYADPDAHGEIPRLGRKRALEDDESTKKSRKSKRSKKEEELASPKNVSGKQYQKEMQKRLLEEARRDDRLILVAARMKNKSKIVKLSLPTGLLDAVRNRPIAERPQVTRQATPEEADEPTGPGSILQSDIVNNQASAPQDLIEKEKASKTFRYRVEADEAYSTRKRDTTGSATKPGKPGRPARQSARFEEVTLDSDDDFGNDDVEYTGRPRVRASNWLARKNQGEEDLPTELPPDFRDGDLRSQQERERVREYQQNRRLTMPAKPAKPAKPAGIRPVGRPPKKAQHHSIDDATEENVRSEDKQQHDPVRRNTESLRLNSDASEDEGEEELTEDMAQQIAMAAQASVMAAVLAAKKKFGNDKNAHPEKHAAIRAAEENIRAKMALFNAEQEASRKPPQEPPQEPNNLVDDFLGNLSEDAEDTGDDEPSAQQPAEPMRPLPRPATNSILGRPGMEGKKIKIVGASSKRDTPAKPASPAPQPAPSGFTPVNRRPQTVSLPDSDSEADIPASKPVVQKVVRPAMVPTRGTGRRGRGRPRKNP